MDSSLSWGLSCWYGRTRNFALGIASLALTSVAVEAQRPSRFTSRAEFANASGDEFLALGARGPDSSKAAEQVIREVSAALRLLAGPPFPRVRVWNGGETLAHPVAGILVDLDQIEKIASRVGALLPREARPTPPEVLSRQVTYFAMAHEHAHTLQQRQLAKDSLTAPLLARLRECHADIVGTYLYVGATLVDSRPVVDLSHALEVLSVIAYALGSDDWLDHLTHPVRNDRVTCVRTGFLVAAPIFLREHWRSAPTLPKPVLDGIASFARDEPELAAGRLSVHDWAMRKAITLVNDPKGSAIELQQHLALRDTSLSVVVREIESAVKAGDTAWPTIRDSLTGALIPSLTPPWLCSVDSLNFAAPWRARCEYAFRGDSVVADTVFRAVSRSVHGALSDLWERSECAQDQETLPAFGQPRAAIYWRNGDPAPGHYDYPTFRATIVSVSPIAGWLPAEHTIVFEAFPKPSPQRMQMDDDTGPARVDWTRRSPCDWPQFTITRTSAKRR